MRPTISERLLSRAAPWLCLATLAAPFVVWFISTGDLRAYWSASLPPGQLFYVFSKLFGLLTMVLLWLQMMAALAKHAPLLNGFVRLKGAQHALLGITTLAAALAHASLFIVASTLRTRHLALDLLMPTFTHGFYRAFVGLGAIALWLLLVVVFAGWRRSIGRVGWRWVHRVALVVFLAGFLHGVVIGSETRFGLMTYAYAFLGMSACAAWFSVLWAAVRRPRIAQGTPHAAPIQK